MKIIERQHFQSKSEILRLCKWSEFKVLWMSPSGETCVRVINASGRMYMGKWHVCDSTGGTHGILKLHLISAGVCVAQRAAKREEICANNRQTHTHTHFRLISQGHRHTHYRLVYARKMSHISMRTPPICYQTSSSWVLFIWEMFIIEVKVWLLN